MEAFPDVGGVARLLNRERRYQVDTIYLVEGARTPIGSFMGQFAAVPAPTLGSVAIRALLDRSGLTPTPEQRIIDEVLMGCVLPAGQGQAPARQAMRLAGLPDAVGATTLNKVCGSGMKAVMVACAEIRAGQAELLIAGGMESMSQVPFYVKDARGGLRLGHQSLLDGLIYDGLWDPYNDFHMGNAAELCAQKYSFSRQAQDEYAALSYQRALATIEAGGFQAEIAPVTLPQKRGEARVLDTDEQPFKGDVGRLPELRPAFQKEGGTITAGNASSINDGAAALLVASQAAVDRYGLKPRAKILGAATFSQDPAWFTTAPVGAIQKVLKQCQLSPQDIDLYEINEAFAVVVLAAMQELSLPAEKVNVRGGAVSLGHPIGASGARILVTLLHALEQREQRLGLATLCIGGGEAVAVVIERLP